MGFKRLKLNLGFYAGHEAHKSIASLALLEGMLVYRWVSLSLAVCHRSPFIHLS